MYKENVAIDPSDNVSLHKQALLKDVLGGNCEFNSNFSSSGREKNDQKKKC